MIFYATKNAVDRLKLPLSDKPLTDPTDIQLFPFDKEQQESDPLFQWGLKLFNFQRKKCLLIMNAASRLAVVLYDVRVKDVPEIQDRMYSYIYKIFENDSELMPHLYEYVEVGSQFIYQKMQMNHRSLLGLMNNLQLTFLWDGDRFYEYVQDGVLDTVTLHRHMNFDWLSGKKDAPGGYVVPAQEFRRLVLEWFS